MEIDKSGKNRVILRFSAWQEFEDWLADNHGQSTGVWLLLYKKDSGVPSLNYAEALDCALCYGWIDGQKDKYDQQSWLQYFCKRKNKSLWSQVNRVNVERLIQAGRMRPAGLAAIEAAKLNGQWDAAYQGVSSRVLPPELAAALDQNPQAKAFFESLNSQNRYAFIFRVATAKKAETKAKKVEEFVRMLANGETLIPKK